MHRRAVATFVMILAALAPAGTAEAAGCRTTVVVETCAATENVSGSFSHCHNLGGTPTTYECFATFTMDSAWGHGTLSGSLVGTLSAYQGSDSDSDACTWSDLGGECTVRSSSNPFRVSSSGITMYCNGFSWVSALASASAVTAAGTYTDYTYISFRIFAPSC